MPPADPPAPGPAAPGPAAPGPAAEDVERYARAAAQVAGLQIDDAWWPTVIRNLGSLLGRAASLEVDGLPDDPAPVFRPCRP